MHLMLLLGDEICGLVDYHVQPLKTSRYPEKHHDLHTFWLSDLMVHPHYRKLGIGQMLPEASANYSRYLDKRQMMIEAEGPEQEQLMRFLERNGFIEKLQCKKKHRPLFLSATFRFLM